MATRIINRSQIHIGKNGVMTDKFGRTFETSPTDFKRSRKRGQVSPAIRSLKLIA